MVVRYLSELFSGIGELGTLVTWPSRYHHFVKSASTPLDGDTYCSNHFYAALLKIIVNNMILIYRLQLLALYIDYTDYFTLMISAHSKISGANRLIYSCLLASTSLAFVLFSLPLSLHGKCKTGITKKLFESSARPASAFHHAENAESKPNIPPAFWQPSCGSEDPSGVKR